MAKSRPMHSRAKPVTELNRRRADTVTELLGRYTKNLKFDADAAVTDLLTDLMHFCHQHRLDFSDQLRRSALHFESEVNER